MNTNLQHWRGFWSTFGLGAAPVLEFVDSGERSQPFANYAQFFVRSTACRQAAIRLPASVLDAIGANLR